MTPTHGQSGPARPGQARPPAAPGGGAVGVALDPIKLLKQYLWWLVAAAALGVGVGLAAHFAFLRFYPLYSSEVTFEMTSPITDAGSIITTVVGNEAEIERFIGGQVFILRSDSLLLDTVRNDPSIRNDTRWAKKYLSKDTGRFDENEMVKDLGDIVVARAIPQSNIVVLSAVTHNPEDAATIVGAVKGAYLRQLDRDKNSDSQDILAALSSQLRSVQEERRLTEDRMNQLLVDNQVTSMDERIMVQTQDLQSLLPVIVDVRRQLGISRDTLKSYEEQLAAPGGATYPEDVRAAVDENSVIQRYKVQEADFVSALRAARARLGDNNMQTRSIQNSLASLREAMRLAEERLLEETFAQTIEGVRSSVRGLEAAQIETQSGIDKARARLADLKRVSEEYNQLKDDQARLAAQEASFQAEVENQRAIVSRKASSRVRVRYNQEVPDKPIFPRIEYMVPGGMILVVVLTAGLIVLREVLEQRIRGPQDVTLIPRTRVLGVIPEIDEDPSRPKTAEWAVRDRPAGVIAESVRQIRTLVLKRFAQRGHKSLLVVGGMPGSGTSTLVSNLAYSLAASDHRVLVIDANFRRPAVHKYFGVSEGPGLGETLTGSTQLVDAAQTTGEPNIDVLTAGSPGTRVFERLTTAAMSRVLDEARARYDLVLVDAPPAIVAGDATALANRCDAAVLVVRAYSEKRGLVARVRDQLGDSRAEFMGVVINAVRSSAGGYFRRNIRTAYEYQNGLAEELDTARTRARATDGDALTRTADSE